MTSATSPAAPITKPRLSMLILEGTVSAVAAILLAWLLLWFVRQRSRELSVDAMYTDPAFPAEADVPFQAADVQSLRGAGTTETSRVEAVGPDALVDAVKNVVRRQDAPAVVYVSAPILGDGPDASIGSTSIRALVETVVREARRDVVLALDLAQLDTDRDLGVFGNSPYNGLADAVAGLAAGDRCVYVLTSAAPAQKSWWADGLGRSVFAYYLREGLDGKAQGWDAPETQGQTSVEGLHRYINRHVAQWAKNHRDAVQTPMLLKIGGGPRKVALPFRRGPGRSAAAPLAEIALKATPDASKSEPPPVEKAEPSKKTDPAAAQPPRNPEPGKPAPSPSNPRDRAFASLLDEWTRHDDLLKQNPYRDLPVSWRSYQTELTRVERRLRAAWNVEGAIDSVAQKLKNVGERRRKLEDDLKAVHDSRAAFPLRPARDDEEGRRAVAEALIHLTGAAPDDGPFTAPPPRPRPAPPPNAPSPDAKGKEEQPARSEPPRPLVDALAGGFPEPYLELQLPAWALRFTQEFAAPDHFKDDRRGAMLRRLVQARSRAEDALAVDRRGLDWIRPILTLGDDQRRAAQDQLFGPDSSDEDRNRRFIGEVVRFDRNYASALEVIQVYRDARDAWERAAAEVPELAEAAVRARAGRDSSNARLSAASPLPEAVTHALDASAALIDALDRPPPSEQGAGFLEVVRKPVDDLQAAARAVQAAVDELEKQLLASARVDDARDWTTLDAALRAPLIPVEARRRALEALLQRPERLDLQADPGSIAPDAYAPDPGFWRLAVGLASLDRELRRIGRIDRRDEEPASQPIKDAWRAVQAAPDAPETIGLASPMLKQYGAEAKKARVRDAVARADRRRDKGRSPEDVGLGLRLDDRAARLLCAAAAVRPEEPPVDSITRAWAAFADYQTLGFHVERLRQDHAANLASLRRRADDLADGLGIAPGRDRAGGSALRIVTTPPASSTLKIGEDGTAALAVEIAAPDEGLVRSEPPPRGRAFVGMAVPPSGLRIRVEGADGSSSPPGRLVDVGPSAQEAAPTRFILSQADLENNASAFKTAAKIFFRGRVDEQGAVVVDVLPRSFPSLVLVDVGQDPHDLEARFGKGAADRIQDQFKKHPGEGYMHEGKDAAYVLTFKNVTFRKLTVAFKRTLVDPAGAVPPIPIDAAEQELTIAPGASAQVPGKVTSLQTPKGQVRNLTVALRVKESKSAAPDFVVRFRQIDHERYMNIEELIREDDFKGVRQPCYVVRFTRRADDPVREPIKGNELSCTIEGETGGSLGADFEFLPGASIKTTHPYTPGKNQFTWSGRIENEVVGQKKPP